MATGGKTHDLKTTTGNPPTGGDSRCSSVPASIHLCDTRSTFRRQAKPSPEWFREANVTGTVVPVTNHTAAGIGSV